MGCDVKKIKPGQDSQSLFINPRSDRKSISVACNYSHADSVKKKSLFFIYHQGQGRAEVVRTLTARFTGQSNCFSLKHTNLVTHSHYCAHVYIEPKRNLQTVTRKTYKQFLDNDAHTTVWSRMHIKLNSIIMKDLKPCVSHWHTRHFRSPCGDNGHIKIKIACLKLFN